MDEMVTLNASLDVWDTWTKVAFFAVLFGVIGESILEFTSWIPESKFREMFGKASALLLIAGLGGEIITHANTTSITSLITAKLDESGKIALQAANEAKLGLEQSITENLKLRTELFEKTGVVETGLATTKAKVSEVSAKAAKADGRIVRPRQRELFARVKGNKRSITLLMLVEAEANAYAKDIAGLLTKSKFAVKSEEWKEPTSATGVIVCNNRGGSLNVFKELKRAGIATNHAKSGLFSGPDFCGLQHGDEVKILVAQQIAPQSR